MEHGTSSGYFNHDCRCDACRAAAMEYQRARRQAKKGQQPARHGLTGYMSYACRCEVCRAAMAARNKRSQKANPDTWKRAHRRHNRKYMVRYNAKTLDAAHRWGYVWTGPELEIVTRSDMTVREIAAALGRTYSAVARMRALVKTDPRKAKLAGLSS